MSDIENPSVVINHSPGQSVIHSQSELIIALSSLDCVQKATFTVGWLKLYKLAQMVESMH